MVADYPPDVLAIAVGTLRQPILAFALMTVPASCRNLGSVFANSTKQGQASPVACGYAASLSGLSGAGTLHVREEL